MTPCEACGEPAFAEIHLEGGRYAFLCHAHIKMLRDRDAAPAHKVEHYTPPETRMRTLPEATHVLVSATYATGKLKNRSRWSNGDFWIDSDLGSHSNRRRSLADSIAERKSRKAERKEKP